MTHGRIRILALSFLFLSLVSIGYMSYATLNYLGFYPALNQLQAQVVNLSFSRSPINSQSTVTARINITNPTAYSGFRIAHVSITVTLYLKSNPNNTRFAAPYDLNASTLLQDRLGPNSENSVTIPIQLDSGQTSTFVNFINQYGSDVMALVIPRVDIETFLESVSGSVVLGQIQYLPIS